MKQITNQIAHPSNQLYFRDLIGKRWVYCFMSRKVQFLTLITERAIRQVMRPIEWDVRGI